MTEKKDWTREELEKHYVGHYKVVTIATDIRVEGQHRVLDLSELAELLRGARRIAQLECDCRTRMGNCDAPLHGCLSLNGEADSVMEKGIGREVSVEEALKTMEETHEAGLVHLAYTEEGEEEPTIICSCCKCCCHSLSAVVRFGYDGHIISSKKIAENDLEACTACGLCVERCQFEARKISGDRLRFDPDKCAGCGLCVSVCPAGGIVMVDRGDEG